MDYQEFLLYLEENLPEYLKQYSCRKGENENREADAEGKEITPEYKIEFQQMMKNNGVVLDGIVIHKTGENASPNIYLNDYYSDYQMGKPASLIMEEIVYQYHRIKAENDIAYVNLSDFKKVRDSIVMRMVNYDKNRGMLKTCPHKRYLDLAIVFRYMAGRNSIGIASSLIRNEEFELWDISLEELYQTALFNTMREFPWHMDSLAKVIVENFKSRMPEEDMEEVAEELSILEQTENGVSMFVLSNDSGVYGAACILYDSVLRNFARVQECNIFILPSSVHEVMLVPENTDTEPEFLAELVEEANRSAVGLVDLLSDHIYYYDREKDQIAIYGQN